MGLIQLESVGYYLLRFQLRALKSENIDNFSFRNIGFMQFLEQFARVNLGSLGKYGGSGSADIGSIVIQTLEKQLFGTTLDILEADFRQNFSMHPGGCRDHID